MRFKAAKTTNEFILIPTFGWIKEFCDDFIESEDDNG